LTADPVVLILTLALTLVAAYLVADAIARALQKMLRAIIEDPHIEALFVDRPRRIVRIAIFLLTAAALALPALSIAGYRTNIARLNREAIADWALDSGLRIAIIIVVGYCAIRVGSAAARRFEREMSVGTGLDVIERAKRAQTLARLIQNTLSITVMGISGLMILRELEIDITPVLTGAGIVGLAVGFGAQTLVRDIISGFFLIVEDQVRVGDVAVVNGQGGAIEQVNLRTIVLRDEHGAVHVFPNGEVKTLSNLSKDFSYYVITVGVAYDDDPDRVGQAMKDASDSLMAEPEYRQHILEPLEVYGVDAFDAGQMQVKGRIKTVPQKQWLVGRELRKRIARLFRERGIEVPVAQMHLKVDRPTST
jgi:moderate conductance mechanosensitive channel